MIPTYTYRATVSRVVAGDTVELLVDVGFRVEIVQRVRLAGVRAPEQGAASRFAKLALETVLRKGQPVTLRSLAPDTQGRYLGELYDSPRGRLRCLNAWLVGEELAAPEQGAGRAS